MVISSSGYATDMISATIKTHHNLALPQRMMEGQGLRLIEPLRELFKDEVRDLGRQLGLPHELVMRHPFPGMCKSSMIK